MFVPTGVEFSLQLYYPDNGKAERWMPISNRETLLKELRILKEREIPYKVVTLWNEFVLPVTHLFCERMLWGFNSVGVGLSEKALKGNN